MRRRPTVLLALCATVAVAGPAYAAGGHPGPTGKASSTPSAPISSSSPRSDEPLSTPPHYSPPADPPDAVTSTAKVTISPSNTFDVTLDPKGKKPGDATWPDARSVFTKAELAQILPGLTSVDTGGCTHSALPGGRTSTHDTTCVLTLHLPKEPANDPSRIVVDVRGFGTAPEIGKRWDHELTAQRARSQKRPGLYTFFRNKDLGVTSSYTDGTVTRVLLSKGPVTGEIWFSGIGFTKLADDYLTSRAAYRDTIVPELITLLGNKMRGHPRHTAE